MSFNKGNAYILFCIFTRNQVTENLIKLKQDEQMMIREKHVPEEITGPLTTTTVLTSWPTHGAHPFHRKSLHKQGTGALEAILSFPNTKAPHVLQLHGCMVFGGIRLFVQHTCALLSTNLDQVLAGGDQLCTRKSHPASPTWSLMKPPGKLITSQRTCRIRHSDSEAQRFA